jgi:SAM-dependent methyltransferase
MDAPVCPKGVVVEGLERVVRGGEPIKVHGYAGGRFPFQDGSFDMVIVADVLHHEEQPEKLLDQCARVSRRLLVIKDHQIKGLLARQRVSFIDWAANAPYGVPCLYRYNTPEQWAQVPRRHGLEVVEELSSMKVYPPLVNTLFGGSLHYFAVLAKGASSVAG